MIPLNFNASQTLFLSIAQGHLTILFSEGKIFDPVFRGAWLKQLRSCPMCLGFWTALIVGFTAGVYHPLGILAIAGIGHMIFLAREKYLPCDKCKIPKPIPFRLVNHEKPATHPGTVHS